MPAKSPPVQEAGASRLKALGEQLRARRKHLRVSSTAAAEAAGISRVTLHRIEKGEPSVTAGAWASAMAVLGMTLQAAESGRTEDAGSRPEDPTRWIPVRVRLADYPQLRALAWHVSGSDTLRPVEALNIYERNERHLDLEAMAPGERSLLQALRTALGTGPADQEADGV
jgi:transcriptional regulator with XRE-family HTH domain